MTDCEKEIIRALQGRLAGGVYFVEMSALLQDYSDEALAKNLIKLKGKGLVKWDKDEEVYYSFVQLDQLD